jgi:uncharacterized repeat protein (TIGR03803 family)
MKKEDGMKTQVAKTAVNFKRHIHSLVRYCDGFLHPGLLFVLLAATASCPAQILTTLATFDGTHGGNPQLMTLAQGLDGNLYGTAKFGGTSGNGVIFKISGGVLTVMHNFTGVAPEGKYPVAGLLLGTNGNFYGTTEQGGTGAAGTIFKLTPAAVFVTLHGFSGVDGYLPDAPLIQVGGYYYGTTTSGGTANAGAVYTMSGAGVVKDKYSFGGTPDGGTPRAPVLYASDGKVYGTTELGGTLFNPGGTVFRMSTAGIEKVLQSFDGDEPYGGLVQGPDGSFYGTTLLGGLFSAGTIFKVSADGKTLTKLHDFGLGTNDGAQPFDGLVLGSDGYLYGTTSAGLGTANEYGTIFRIATDGSNYSILYRFQNTTDGSFPKGGLLQATDGNFYGTTDRGGTVNNAVCLDGGTCGVVFQFSMNLGPFVKALSAHGKVGAVIKILGNSLLSTSAVAFNGTPAVFHIVSGTELTATVPVGATTGPITVTTPSGNLQTIVPFHVP